MYQNWTNDLAWFKERLCTAATWVLWHWNSAQCPMWSNSISALTECPLTPTMWMVAVNPWITLTRCDLRMSIEKENSLVEQNAFIVHPKGIWSLLVTNKMVKKLCSTEGTAQEKEEKNLWSPHWGGVAGFCRSLSQILLFTPHRQPESYE